MNSSQAGCSANVMPLFTNNKPTMFSKQYTKSKKKKTKLINEDAKQGIDPHSLHLQGLMEDK